jgi:hypothetical protein
VTENEVRAIAKVTVEETMLYLGVDVEDPTEVQKDMAFLRNWRESTQAVKRQGLIAAVGVLVLGVLGLIWSALKG